MAGKKLKNLLIILFSALILWFFIDSFSQPGPKDLAGNFREAAFYRNENNTGPIVRIYAVTVADTLWQEMQQYGNFMPHTKYGKTTVYFFREGQQVPRQVSPGEQHFEQQFAAYCLARYEKDAMGQVTFTRWPFRP